MRRLNSTILLVLITNVYSFSQNLKFAPQISLMYGYTGVKDMSVITAGKFNTLQRKSHFAFSAKQKAQLPDLFFFDIGLKFNKVSEKVNAINQINEIVDNSIVFSWKNNSYVIAVPLYLGRYIYFDNHIYGGCYAGVSLGMVMYRDVEAEILEPNFKDNQSLPNLTSVLYDNSENRNEFLATFDIGVDFFPIRKISKLGVGLLFSTQLNSTKEVAYLAFMEDRSIGYDFLYQKYEKKRITNFSIVLSYTF